MSSLRDALTNASLTNTHQTNTKGPDSSTLASQYEDRVRTRMTQAATLNEFRKVVTKAIAESPHMIDEALRHVVRFNYQLGGKKLATQLVEAKTEMEQPEFDLSNPERLERWLGYKFR